jgi:hypothetical protein
MTAELQETAERYIQELKEHGEFLKTKALNCKEEAAVKAEQIQTLVRDTQGVLQPKVKQIAREVEMVAKDMSPVSSAEHRILTESYMWTAICLFAFTLAQVVGKLLHPIIGLFLTSPLVRLIIVMLLTPMYLYLVQKKTEMEESKRRLFNLVGAVFLGLGFGFEFAFLRLSFFAPPVFLAPIGVIVAAGVLKLPARMIFLGACAGISTVVYILYGFVFGLRASYLFWVLVYAASIAFDTQLKIGKIKDGAVPQAEHMLTIICCAQMYAIMHVLHGSKPEDAVEA